MPDNPDGLNANTREAYETETESSPFATSDYRDKRRAKKKRI